MSKVFTKLQAFKVDIKGSDTTEKVGMVLAAAVIIGLLIVAMQNFMPDMFEAIITKAQNFITGFTPSDGVT